MTTTKHELGSVALPIGIFFESLPVFAFTQFVCSSTCKNIHTLVRASALLLDRLTRVQRLYIY